jgi:hypothetical protein
MIAHALPVDAPLLVPVSAFLCDHCHAPATFIAPGSLEQRSSAGDMLIRRGEPVRCACWSCRLKGVA